MDEPPGGFTHYVLESLIAPVGLFVVFTTLAALLAAARTALHFAASVGRDDMSWVVSTPFAQRLAEKWIPQQQNLSISLQIGATLMRTAAITSLIASAMPFGGVAAVLETLLPGMLIMVLLEATFRLFARKYPVGVFPQIDWVLTGTNAALGGTVARLAHYYERWQKRFGKRKSTEEVLEQVLQLAAVTRSTEKEVVKGMVNFGTLRVSNVMRSRQEVTSVNTELDFHQLVTFINTCGYSRMPAYRGNIDQIVGVLYIKDLLPHLGQSAGFKWQDLLRPAYFAEPSKRIDLLLRDFQENRVHIAVIRNPNGTTAGLVTLEDLIEVVIREINERDDMFPDGYRRLDERNFLFDGKAPLRDVFELIDVDYPQTGIATTPASSLEDFIVEINDELPAEGEEVSYDQFTFVVEAVEQKRIKRVRITIHAQA